MGKIIDVSVYYLLTVCFTPNPTIDYQNTSLENEYKCPRNNDYIQYFTNMPITRIWLQVLLQLGAVNTLKPRQDGRHFPDDIFKCIFLNENV